MWSCDGIWAWSGPGWSLTHSTLSPHTRLASLLDSDLSPQTSPDPSSDSQPGVSHQFILSRGWRIRVKKLNRNLCVPDLWVLWYCWVTKSGQWLNCDCGFWKSNGFKLTVLAQPCYNQSGWSLKVRAHQFWLVNIAKKESVWLVSLFPCLKVWEISNHIYYLIRAAHLLIVYHGLERVTGQMEYKHQADIRLKWA